MRRVLVIDQDAAFAQALARLLASVPYEVVTAADGESGLDLVTARCPDLVLLGISTPPGKDLAVAGRLRERIPNVPLILVTAGRESGLRDLARTLGAAGLVERPCPRAELLRMVAEALPPPSSLPTVAVTEVPQPSPFTVESPFQRPRAASPEKEAGAVGGPVLAPAHAKAPSSIAGKTILVVEDDRRIAMAFGLRLRAAGLEVIVVHDAVAGLAAAMKDRPDVLLLDIGLPGGSGIALAERLRYWGRGLTPVIFVTASRKPGLREQAMALGAGFLEKPFEAEDLLAEIRKALVREDGDGGAVGGRASRQEGAAPGGLLADD